MYYSHLLLSNDYLNCLFFFLSFSVGRSFVIFVTSALMLWPILWASERARCVVGHSRGSKSLCMDGSASQKRRAENNRHVAGFCITPDSCTRSVQCALAVVWSTGKKLKTRWKSKTRQGVSCYLIWGFCKTFWETILSLNGTVCHFKMEDKWKEHVMGFNLIWMWDLDGFVLYVHVCERGVPWLNILYKKEIPSKCINYVSLSALSADPEERKSSYRNWMSRGCWQKGFIWWKRDT